MIPRLLVSVRNQSEALLAAQCGVEVIDFKEPENGPLGMVAPSILSPAIQELSRQFPIQTISVACGEAIDERIGESVRLPIVSYFKLGSAGLKNRSGWIEFLKQRQDEIAKHFGEQTAPHFRWIAVAYVDHEAAEAPAPEEILQAAIENECAGVLFDTYTKTAGTLFDFLPVERLRELTRQIHDWGGIVGAAGRLRVQDLFDLCTTQVDLVGIRSAACEQRDRRGVISLEAIQAFQSALKAQFELSCRAR